MAQDRNQPAELDARTVKTLLDKLESDEGFRAEFERSPGDALRSIGHEGADGCLSLKGGKLASPEQIKAQRAKLERAMVGVQKMECALTSQSED